MGKRSKKRPSLAPAPAKLTPRRLRGVAANEGDDHHPVWRLTLLDQEHDVGWSWRIDARTVRRIVDFLTEMERLTWREIWDAPRLLPGLVGSGASRLSGQ